MFFLKGVCGGLSHDERSEHSRCLGGAGRFVDSLARSRTQEEHCSRYSEDFFFVQTGAKQRAVGSASRRHHETSVCAGQQGAADCCAHRANDNTTRGGGRLAHGNEIQLQNMRGKVRHLYVQTSLQVTKQNRHSKQRKKICLIFPVFCRLCGNLVCAKCSPNKHVISSMGKKPRRVCSLCEKGIEADLVTTH